MEMGFISSSMTQTCMVGTHFPLPHFIKIKKGENQKSTKGKFSLSGDQINSLEV
jgi:hypothetical protein